VKRFIGPIASILALILAAAALVVGGFALYGLLQARRVGLAAVTEARTSLAGLSDYTIDTTIPFHHSIPIDAEVPLRQDFVVPIQTTIPISTVARVPISIPLLGTYDLSVPVEAEVPVDLQVVIPVSQTVPVRTVVLLDTEVPVQVEIGRLGLDDLLEQLDGVLAQVEQGLQWPSFSSPEPEP